MAEAVADASEGVLLVSLSNWTGLSRLPSAFSQAGFRVTVFAPAHFLVARSAYVDDVVNAPEPPELFLPALQAFMARYAGTFKHCLVCDDNLMFLLYRFRDQSWMTPLLPAPAAGEYLPFLLLKTAFPVVCDRHRLPVPPFMVTADRPALMAHAQKLGFPCILKQASGFAGLAVQQIPDAGTLRQRLAELPENHVLVLQSFIDGRVGAVSAVWVQGRLKSWFAYHKVQSWPTPFSPACIIRLVDRPALRPILEKLGEISGFNGLGGIDFMETPDGRIWLLEQHARPTPAFLYAGKAGIDLSRALQALVRQDADAEPQQPVIHDTRPIPLFPQEAFRMIESGQRRRMARWLTVPRYREQLFPEDGPLFAMTLQVLQIKAARNRPEDDGIS